MRKWIKEGLYKSFKPSFEVLQGSWLAGMCGKKVGGFVEVMLKKKKRTRRRRISQERERERKKGGVSAPREGSQPAVGEKSWFE